MSRDTNDSVLQAEQTEEYELQCTDCYRIFTSEAPPRIATCETCNSANVVTW